MHSRFIFVLGIAALAILLGMAWMPARASAQLNTFNSGSTGADGAFSPTVSQTIQVPASGVFNYTTVNIPSGVTITYTRNSTKNLPVTILASGDVTILGTITVAGGSAGTAGAGALGGPGGYSGGTGGYGFDTFVGVAGDGPGGGGGGSSSSGTLTSGGGGGGHAVTGNDGSVQTGAVAGLGGQKYGSSTLLPLIGGSGGGGGGASAGNHGGGGGGGGGAILVASSTTISFGSTGRILANGGTGAPAGSVDSGGGGGGSGGAIRLIANKITGGGSGAVLDVSGGSGTLSGSSPPGGKGGVGFVRVEGFDLTAFSPSLPGGVSLALSLPNPVTIPSAPSLRIASVAGVAAPATPLGSPQGAPDIVVPSTTANPVTVAIEAANIPTGTVVQVTMIPSNGSRTNVQSGPLSGTQAASTATASVNLSSGMSVLTATAVVDVSQTAMVIDGERVNRIEVAATFGGPSELTYVTQSGRRIKVGR